MKASHANKIQKSLLAINKHVNGIESVLAKIDAAEKKKPVKTLKVVKRTKSKKQ